MATPSLLDWIMDLLRNDDAREAFHSNPQAALQSAGFSQVCGEDVADARAFIADTPGVERGVKDAFLPEDTDERGVKDAFLPEDTGDVADNIRYIINNYTYNDSHDRYFLVDDDLDAIDDEDDVDVIADDDDAVIAGDDDDDEGPNIDPDGIDQDVDLADNDRVADSIVRDSNLGTQDSFNPAIGESFNDDSSEGQTTVDQSGSVVGDDQVGRDLVEGDAVRNGIGDDNTIGGDAAGRDVDNQDAGLAALDHVVETGDVHLLNDLVNTGDIAPNSLNNLDVLSHVGEQNIVRDLDDVVDLLP